MAGGSANFSVGQVVHHKRFDYRGVVFDVDPIFMGSDAWYDQVAQSRPPKDQPWYHVLPDSARHSTYVAERNLEVDEVGDPIEHPLTREYFSSFENGQYVRREQAN